MSAGGGQRHTGGLSARAPPEASDAWGTTRRLRCGGRLGAICRARTKGPLVAAWCPEDVLVLLPLTPLTRARSREAFTPRRATDAPTDAARHLARLLTPRDTRPALQPQRPPRRARAQRVAPRRRVVGDTGRITQRLPRTRTHYVPHVLHWGQDNDPPMCCACLRRWPPRNAAPLARRSPLEPGFPAHPGRGERGAPRACTPGKPRLPCPLTRASVPPMPGASRPSSVRCACPWPRARLLRRPWPRTPSGRPLAPCVRPCPARHPSWRPAAWAPAGSNAHGLRPPRHGKHRPASRQ